MSRNDSETVQYALRLTFGVVHAVVLTLCTFGLVLWFPSFGQWSFSLLGCIVLPALSALLTVGCTACVQVVSATDPPTWQSVLRRAWMPPLGIFCASLFILPLERIQSEPIGPLSVLMATSICLNAILVAILQNMAAYSVSAFAGANASATYSSSVASVASAFADANASATYSSSVASVASSGASAPK